MSWFALAERLRTWLLEDATIAAAVGPRVHYQTIPSDSELPHIWFTRQGRQTDDLVSDEDGIDQHQFAFELCSNEQLNWVDALVARIESFEGLADGFEVQLTEVEDADDEYQLQSLGEDTAEFVHVFQVTIYGTKE